MYVYRVESSFNVLTNKKVDIICREWCRQMTPYDGMGDADTMKWMKSTGIQWGAFYHTACAEQNTPIPHNDKLLVQNSNTVILERYKQSNFKSAENHIPHWLIDLYHFAFDSEGAMMRWFSREEREQLKEKGFYLAIYAVPDEYVILGDRQLMFRKSHSEQTGFITL